MYKRQDLRRLVMKTSGLVDIVRSALAPIAGEIVAAFVFGSVAKGVDTVSSDIDLMIVSGVTRLPTAKSLQPLSRRQIVCSEPSTRRYIRVQKSGVADVPEIRSSSAYLPNPSYGS